MIELSVVGTLLRQLLDSHNRVSLPGLGAFVATGIPATLIKGGKGMLPPGRRITFQSAESWNDGLLEHALVKHTGLTPEEVKDRLAAFVHRLDTDMRAGVRVEIPALGVLRLTADGELRFAEEGGTTAPEMFGLLEIDMQPVGEELPPAPEFAAVTPEKKRNYRCPMVCWILLALVLLAVGMYIFRRPLEQWLDRMVYTPEELEYLHQNY